MALALVEMVQIETNAERNTVECSVSALYHNQPQATGILLISGLQRYEIPQIIAGLPQCFFHARNQGGIDLQGQKQNHLVVAFSEHDVGELNVLARR